VPAEANVDGIIAFDRECRYTTWNRAMERISGVKRERRARQNALSISFPA
jgi:PAS domain-containing protein